MTQVGVGEIPILPTFKGFRRLFDAEATSASKSAGAKLTSGFSTAGETAGKGFSSAFGKSSSNISAAALRQVTDEVAKASREVSKVRLQEQDATGKVRVAEAQLADARRRYSSDSAQVVRAEERLATVQRQQATTSENLTTATKRLTDARKQLDDVKLDDGGSGGGFFSRFLSSGENAGSRFTSGFKSRVGAIFTGNILADFAASAIRSVTQAAGDAVQTGIEYVWTGINLASGAEQNFGAVQSVFKEYADSVVDNSTRAATSVGLSRSKYSQFAVVVGAQLKNLGIRTEDVAGKTDDLISLGADLAAQFGGPTSDAVGAISSLLRGERDPIERYGVGLKEVDIAARMAADGTSELTGEAEKQARIQATLALLWEQTADAQGTFAREQDTYAGKLQIVTAQLEDMQTGFGNALLPIASDFLSFADRDLRPIIEQALAEAGPKLSESISDVMPEIKTIISSLAEAVPDAIDFGASLVEGIGSAVEVVSDKQAAQVLYDARFAAAQEAGDFQGQMAAIVDYLDILWDGVADTAANKMRETVIGVRYGSDEMKSYWGATLEEMKATTDAIEMQSSGAAFAAGFADGIETSSELAVLAAERMALRARDKAANTMEIRSPSRVMRRMGRHVPEGFALGIDDGAQDVESAMSRMAQPSFASTMASQSAATTGAGAAGSRPVYFDGAFIGWMRELASGEATLVVEKREQTISRGMRL